VTVADVVRATDHVLPSIEIVDSRVRDWKIKIQDTVADNASSAALVLGRATDRSRRGRPRR
jgi:2-keto-4-pentenoate hydratase